MLFIKFYYDNMIFGMLILNLFFLHYLEPTNAFFDLTLLRATCKYYHRLESVQNMLYIGVIPNAFLQYMRNTHSYL